jgi:hypothetical protein
MTLNKRWEEMFGVHPANTDSVGHHSYIDNLGFIKDCPSLQEELKQQRHGHMNYETNLKDHSHDELVGLIKQMDISAKDAAKQIEHKAGIEQHLRSALHVMHGKELLVKTALRDLFEYADLGLYNRDEMDMDDE